MLCSEWQTLDGLCLRPYAHILGHWIKMVYPVDVLDQLGIAVVFSIAKAIKTQLLCYIFVTDSQNLASSSPAPVTTHKLIKDHEPNTVSLAESGIKLIHLPLQYLT